jgi:acyl-CoA reductase-like NAD-dependent aldehyde dehydrogenase
MLAQPSASGTGKAAALAVSGHVLSWGLPLAEVTCAVLPHPLAGHTAVIKPSLRAPMSAAAVAHLATCMGFPPGVINIVQGTGLAEESRAVIITGDDDMLSMDLNPPAITPRALLDRLRSNP